jgi:dephospho-CoA kinase
MEQKHVIALVGMAGSGKGTCTTYLQDHYKWPVVHFGNMVYAEVQRRGLDNVKDEKFVREDMRTQEGKAVIAKHAAREADEHFTQGENVVVLDGLYSWSELKYLSEKYGEALTVIAVATPRKVRYQRILARQDSHRKYANAEEIMKTRDIPEIENLEKGGPIAYADYTILNNSTPEALIVQLNTVLKEVNTLEPDKIPPLIQN